MGYPDGIAHLPRCVGHVGLHVSRYGWRGGKRKENKDDLKGQSGYLAASWCKSAMGEIKSPEIQAIHEAIHAPEALVARGWAGIGRDILSPLIQDSQTNPGREAMEVGDGS